MKTQIAELQKALSETHIQLFDEKRFSLQQQRDNEVLAKNEDEDRRKIQELLALSQDHENESGLENKQPLERRPDRMGESLAIQKSKNETI